MVTANPLIRCHYILLGILGGFCRCNRSPPLVFGIIPGGAYEYLLLPGLITWNQFGNRLE